MMGAAFPSVAAGLLLLLTASLFSFSFATPAEGVALLAMVAEWNVKFESWTPGGDPCVNWQDVLCVDGYVTALNLTRRGIFGNLTSEVGQLSNLVSLDLSFNEFRGPLPNSLAMCSNLQYLDIKDNDWEVPFPMVITRLSKLEVLYASTARLSGPIPKDFYNLKQLRILYLGNNTQLIVSLKDFAQLPNLVNLTVWETTMVQLEIPNELSKLSKLEYFNCHHCGLTGGLPESFGEITTLREINLRYNSLTGGIPDSWKNLKNLRNLRLDSNNLLGPFPDWAFNELPNLAALYLSRNQFYGMPPNISFLEQEYDLPSRFSILRWDCNYLEGPSPCGVSGQNLCSNATLAKRGMNETSQFYFYPNCYTDLGVDDRSNVGYCVGHTLTCEAFYDRVVKGRECPVCPPSQVLRSHSTVSNGCVCESKLLSGSGSEFPVGAVVGGVLGLCLVFVVILGIVLWKRRKQFSFMDIFASKEEQNDNWEIPAGVQRFSLVELARITSDFSDEHIIGSGGFGKVYSGTLDDGRMVAIKRASEGKHQGNREFRNEITLLSRLHHRHLVRLEGFCQEKDFQVLVYEFMKKGNLSNHLYGENAKLGDITKLGTPLSAYKRIEIAYGVAQGLEYLHTFADPPVIHRDVKPSNILLDEHMVAKLGDFGISKESPELETHVSTRPAGTAGYLDPEYFLRRQLTTASDVYAFGVVLLELVTGQVAIDHKRDDEFNLVEWVRKRYLTAGIVSIIDPMLKDDYPKDGYTVLTELALRCSSFSKNERPAMKEVLATMDPLMITRTPPRPPRSESSMDETEWLMGKRQEFDKLYVSAAKTNRSTNGSTIPSIGSDLARTLRLDPEDIGPR